MTDKLMEALHRVDESFKGEGFKVGEPRPSGTSEVLDAELRRVKRLIEATTEDIGKMQMQMNDLHKRMVALNKLKGDLIREQEALQIAQETLSRPKWMRGD